MNTRALLSNEKSPIERLEELYVTIGYCQSTAELLAVDSNMTAQFFQRTATGAFGLIAQMLSDAQDTIESIKGAIS
jgi:hypothetical protein